MIMTKSTYIKYEDYEYFLKFERWEINDAICLLILPADLTINKGEESKFNKLNPLVKDAINAGTLKAYSGRDLISAISDDFENILCEPSDFIKWANSKGFPIPDPLKTLLNEEDTSNISSTDEIPPYLDKKKYREFFSEELEAAIETWLYIYGPEGKISKDKKLHGKPNRKIIDDYLKKEYSTFNKSQKERIAIMINSRKAGAAKT